MGVFEQFLLDSGFSWTISKLLPYVLAVLLGFVLLYVFRKRFKKSVWIKWLLRLVFLVLPFGLYFIYSPIYEGDFSNNSVEVERSPSNAELEGKKLYVLSIPGCPFCYQAIDKIAVLKQREPNIEVEYIVCTSDSLTRAEGGALQWYQDKGADIITVRFSDSTLAMSRIADGRFPTFVLSQGNKRPLKVWSNSNFGAGAMDELELTFH